MPHRVENQPPPLSDYNLWRANPAAARGRAARGRALGRGDARRATARNSGTAQMQEQAALANRNPPVLQTHDRYGHRIDRVDFHPAWHSLMAAGVGAGLHSSPWADPKPGAHVARAAAFMLHAEVENGTLCPLSMTYGSASSFCRRPELAAQWLPAIFTRDYDPMFGPVQGKRGALIGMGMTEKQGGSDVRANTTVASPAGDGTWRLSGHKWFTSAPMCDGFFVTAQTAGAAPGISCFFMPRFLPDGSRNDIRIQRLKDKLGNKSNASSELEFDGTVAWLVGEEGRGIPTILQMGVFTRLDCSLGSDRHHAPVRRAGGAPRPPPPRLRSPTDRAAADAQRAGRHGARGRRRGGIVDAARAGLRPHRQTPSRWNCGA